MVTWTDNQGLVHKANVTGIAPISDPVTTNSISLTLKKKTRRRDTETTPTTTVDRNFRV